MRPCRCLWLDRWFLPLCLGAAVSTPPLPLARWFVGRLLLAMVVLAVLGGATASASAQASLIVMPGANFGLDTQAVRDIAEESAFLAEDLGGFTVYRWYELEGALPARVYDGALACNGDTNCYADTLFGQRFDWLLVLTTEENAGTVYVQYQLLNLRTGAIAGEELVTMATSIDFAVLQTPCHAVLRNARVEAPVAVAPPTSTPEPSPAPGSATPPAGLAAQDAWDRPQWGSRGRAGIYTALGGGVAIFGGVLLGFAADDTQQEIQARPHPRAELEDLQATGELQQTLANVAISIGGIAIATGITLMVMDRRTETAPQGLRVQAVPTGRGVLFDASF